MARYYAQILDGLGDPPSPNARPLSGLKQMLKGPARAALKSQDEVVTQSRRIVMQTGLHGSQAFRVQNLNPDLDTRIYPLHDTELSISKARFELTPGCFLRAVCLYAPAGPTQIDIGGGEWEDGGRTGALRLHAEWFDRSAGSTESDHVLHTEPSALTYGALPTGAGEIWTTLRAKQMDVFPDIDMTDGAELSAHCEHITVELELFRLGSPRIVDFTVYEVPIQMAREADDAGDLWTSHLYGYVAPSNPAENLAYPKTRVLDDTPDGNPRAGSLMALDVMRAQRLRLGPTLIQWHHESEELTFFSTDTVDPLTITSTSGWKNALDTTQAGYDEDRPGWAVGCGGYARDWLHNNPQVIGVDDDLAAIPVVVRVYGRTASGTAGALRLHTRDHSWVDVPMPTGSMAWRTATGWLTVPINPEQKFTAQLLANVPGFATMEVLSLSVSLLRVPPSDF